MNIFSRSNFFKFTNLRTFSGFLLVIAGVILFLERYLQTGWLSFIILPGVGVFLYLSGIWKKNPWLILVGGIVAGVGTGIGAAFSALFNQHEILIQIGLIILYSGFGWLVIVFTTVILGLTPLWWAGIPAGLLMGAGYCFVFGSLNWMAFVFYMSIGLGLAFLLWGLAERLIGLVIPGCLVITTGPAVYYAWHTPNVQNSLVSTGTMLVWLALGWFLITISGRVLIHRFIWWPLIPGGILAVVGWGLYIGGDPDNALGFISNTGSIGLMIFGLYLLLMRKGIHH